MVDRPDERPDDRAEDDRAEDDRAEDDRADDDRAEDDRADDRIEREINEILNKIEHFPDAGQRRARERRRAVRRAGERVGERQRAVAAWLGRFTISQVMLLSFLLILGSIFLRRMNPAVTQWVLIAGIALFIASFAMLIFGGGRGGGGGEPRYWRGRRVTYDQRPGLGSRIRGWFRRSG